MLKIFWVLCSYEGFRNITSVALRDRSKDLHFIDEEMETQKKRERSASHSGRFGNLTCLWSIIGLLFGQLYFLFFVFISCVCVFPPDVCMCTMFLSGFSARVTSTLHC